jgi:hypothetical protein
MLIEYIANLRHDSAVAKAKFNEKYIYTHALILYAPLAFIVLIGLMNDNIPLIRQWIMPLFESAIAYPIELMVELLVGVILPVAATVMIAAGIQHYVANHKRTKPKDQAILFRMISLAILSLIIPIGATIELINAISGNTQSYYSEILIYPIVGASIFFAILSLYHRYKR